MSTTRVLVGRSNPINAEFKDDAGHLMYITRHPDDPVRNMKDIFSTEIIAVRASEGEVIALFDHNPTHGKPTITLSGQLPMPTRELLRSAGAMTRTRIFQGGDGREFKWEICHKYLRLRSTDKDDNKDLALYHFEQKYGKNKHLPYLEIFYGLSHMQDLILITCILMETNRIWTNAKIDSYIDRVFSSDTAYGAYIPGGSGGIPVTDSNEASISLHN